MAPYLNIRLAAPLPPPVVDADAGAAGLVLLVGRTHGAVGQVLGQVELEGFGAEITPAGRGGGNLPPFLGLRQPFLDMTTVLGYGGRERCGWAGYGAIPEPDDVEEGGARRRAVFIGWVHERCLDASRFLEKRRACLG